MLTQTLKPFDGALISSSMPPVAALLTLDLSKNDIR